MDKSESELLEDWDVVSSVYDTEQESDVAEKENDSNTSTNTNGNIDVNANCSTGNEMEVNMKTSVADSGELASVDTKPTVDPNTAKISEKAAEAGAISEQTTEPDVICDQATESDAVPEQTTETDAVSEHTTDADSSAEEISEIVTVIEQTAEVDVAVEQNSEVDDIVEQLSEVDTVVEENSQQNTVSNTEVDTEKNAEINIEQATDEENNIIKRTTDENIESIDDDEIEKTIENKNDADEKKITEAEAVTDYNSGTRIVYLDNSDDHAVNSSLDSSMEHIQIEYLGESCVQDAPELLAVFNEQENAAIESSSSDIDIIDECVEDSIRSSFIHPSSLSISSSVDTSSVFSTLSKEDKEVKIEPKTQDFRMPEKIECHTEKSETFPRTFEFCAEKPQSYSKSDSYSTKSESYPKASESHFKKSRHEDENVRPKPQKPLPHQASSGIFAGILAFLRNITRFEWSILGGVVLCLYVTIVFNQTNIFAVVEKENVVSQMKKMIDELKLDNKILKNQMLSEMKNEKVFSSVEHQIRELKKENSKLNHMLYDVVKVLEEQKDSQANFKKKEHEYIEPFKKEINKLKEHINILKFDNEELQQQLVRMRYASYSQGGRDTSDEKTKRQKEETKADETASDDEIALDFKNLQKWNELVTLLTKELGLLSEHDPMAEEKSHSDAKKNISWYWKVFLREFKGTFKDFKENVTSIISDYKQANEKAVSEIYKFVKDFFTVEESKQQYTPPSAESSQWNNIGDFVKDLGEKWTNIKERIYTSDIKNFLRNFRKSGEADTSKNFHHAEKTKSAAYESNERKPTNVHFESERKPTDAHFESERKPTNVHFESERKHANFHSESGRKVQSDSEETKWMFKRAELRAELREAENEDPSENWFLKKKKRASQEDTEKNTDYLFI